MRLAFIGGNGHHYLKGIVSDAQLNPGLSVAVAGDGADSEAARRWAGGLGVSYTWYDDPRKLLDEFKPEFVSVGAVYARNGEMAILCGERGVPVCSDKPVAVTWEQLERVRKVFRAGSEGASARVLATEFDFRCRAEFRAARDAVARGEIGEPVLLTAQKSYRFGTRPKWYGERAVYGGTMLWIASHGIDALRFVAGRRITSAMGRQGNLSHPELPQFEDHCSALFALEGGATGIVHADFLRPVKAATHGDDRLRVAGTRGVLEVRDGRCRLTTHDQPERDITDSASPQPIHRALLDALRGQSQEYYGTAWSLELAAVMLAARDGADKQAPAAVPTLK